VSEPSEYKKAWQRFRRNRPALAGLCFILLAVFIAIFGYVLAPDHSPDANTQFSDLALQPPGTQVTLLPVKLNSPPPSVSWLSMLWAGNPPSNRLIPVVANSLRLEGDSIHFQYLGGKNRTGSVHLLQLFLAVPDSISVLGTDYVFKNTAGDIQHISKTQLIEKWKSANVLSSRFFALGTDKYGRCMLSRLLLGFRISLMVGLIAVAISLTIGLFLGMFGGYFGGRLDDLVMLLVNTVWSIPTLLLVFAIVLALGRGIGIIFLAVGLTMWVDVARIVRGQALALRSLPFVEAAQSMGLGHWRILRRHILPNLLGPVLVVAAGNFATAILVESGLSYLGFGVQPPTPSWGSMLNENYGYAISGKPLLALLPAIAIALTVLAFNLVGNGLRDALDVKDG
jgi:peptide/nickel transport system permease protein